MASIGDNALDDCYYIKEVVLGDNVTSIGKEAFKGCSGIKKISLMGTTPPAVGSNNFTNAHFINSTVYVPKGTLAKYQSADIWKDFCNIQEYYLDKYFYVNYIVDGETYAIDSVKHGDTIILKENPTKDGFTFSGWSEAPETMPAEDIVISGTFGVNSYTITYKVDGEEYKTVNVAFGAKVELIDVPTKEGHTFSGWSEAPATMPAKDIVINGTFTVNSYKITYRIEDEEKQVDVVNYGTAIVPPTTFDKEGYELIWSNLPDTMPAKDIVVNGSYSLKKYLVTYIADGDTIATDSIAYGSAIKAIDAPDKEGHTFTEWKDVPHAMPAKDIVLTASYSVNNYVIKYVIGENVIATDTVAYGSTIKLIDNQSIEGHTFSGWNCEYTTMPAKDIVISGSFTVNSYTVTYKVDGEVHKTVNVAFGAKVELIDVPTKEGHTFSGWSEAPETMPANNVTIEGSFTVNSYKVTYKVDGTEYKTVNVNFGEKVELIAAPTKDGFTFSGWSEAPETMPAKDIVISGTFGVNSYTITYKVDGEEYKTVNVAFGAKVELIAAPTKEGHTFSGWSEAPETMPAKDITIEGSFTVNSYTVTFMIDGEIYGTATIEYGTEIELPTVTEKEGYTFSGWENVPETMPAKDMIIQGSYIVDTAIEEIYLDLKNSEVYNLRGLRITETDKLVRGIYIINGKKIFVK